MKITRIDPFTQKENTMELDITQAQLARWQNAVCRNQPAWAAAYGANLA